MKSAGLNSYIDRMERWGNRVYLVGSKGYRTTPWTFRAVRSAILRLSAVLAEIAIGKGDRVVIFGRSCPEWVVAYFAILNRGSVVVPIDKSASPEFFRRIVKKAGPSLVIGEPLPIRTKLSYIPFSSIEELLSPEQRTEFGEGALSGKPFDKGETTGETLAEGDLADNSLAENSQSDISLFEGNIAEDFLAELVFTSGTTSEPKGVMLTHGNILSNLRPIAAGIDRREKAVRLLTPFRILCTVPYSHMFGQATGIFLPILLGSTIYFTQDTGPAALIRAIKRFRILALIAVPRVLKLLVDHVKAELLSRGKMPSFQRRWDRWVSLPYPVRMLFFFDIHRMLGLHFWAFIVGGAPLDHDTHEFWRRLVFSVFQGYGLTEAAPMVTMFNPFRHHRQSVGKLFPGQEVKIGPDGEIFLRGENVMAGYYGDRKSTREVLVDGWLRTGDIGEIDGEGHLFIKGRVKDMICTSDGHNVFAEDVEWVLKGIEGVREAMVYGKDERGGETVQAVLILDRTVQGEEVIRKANSLLLPYQRIRGFSIWSGKDFPRTPTQKVKKAEVIQALGRGKAAAFETKDILEGLVPGRVDPGAKLVEELGLDSLDLVEVVSRVEKKYGVSIDETIIGPGTTVADLEKLAYTGTAVPAAGRASGRAARIAAGSAAPLPMPRWARSKPVSLIRRLIMDLTVLPWFRIPFRVRTRGTRFLLETKEPCIIAANHISNIDPIFLLLAIPRRFRRRISPALGLNRFHAFFTRFRTEKPVPARGGGSGGAAGPARFLRYLHRIAYFIVTFLFQTFPFPQGTAFRPSLEYTGELLDDGFWILIFPEGEVGRSVEPGKFRSGVAKIAELTEAPIVPMGISWERARRFLRAGPAVSDTGTPSAKKPLSGFKRKTIAVAFGAPIRYRGEGYDVFSNSVETVVRELVRGS